MWPPRVLPHFVDLSGPKSAFRGSNLKLAGPAGHSLNQKPHTGLEAALSPARQLEGLAAHLELLSLVKHSPEL